VAVREHGQLSVVGWTNWFSEIPAESSHM
jgi:hypothetical protein